jgi:beta-lactamase regulating signal transducer with metallopeptidase domain
MVWVFVLVLLLVLPLAQAVSPIWQIPVIPEVGSWWRSAAGTGEVAVPSDKPFELEGPVEPAGTEGRSVHSSGSAGYDATWHAWVFFIWSAGTLLSLSWLLFRAAIGERLLKRSGSAGESWRSLLEETAPALGLEPRTRLFESGDVKAAVTVGAINPAIVVPTGSSEWPHERRRYILSHELAHVKRRDGLTEVLVLVASSIYWLNPLVWLAVKSLRIERERDCDDAVLVMGAKPSDYALFLMDIAAELGTPPRPVWQLSTISQGSNIKDRIMSILDPKVNRNRRTRATVIVTCLLLASLIIPLSISGIWETQAQEKSDKQKQEELELKKKKEMELKKKMSGMTPEEKVNFMWEKIEIQENSAAVLVHDAIVKNGPGAGKKMVKKLKKSGDDTYYFKESEFNTLGYVLLYGDKTKEAIEVFDLNVKMYPESWNTYDSLGEGYLVAGKLDKARKYYEKSIAMNPENENGREMLAKIAEKEKSGEKVAKKE